MENQLHRKILAASLSSIVLSFTVFFFSPLGIFFANINEWPIPASAALLQLLLLCLFSSTLLTIFLLLFRSKNAFYIGIAIVFALTLVVWLQMHFFSWNFGVLDGRAINWGENYANGLIEFGAWILIISFAILNARFFYKWIFHLTIFLFVLQAVFISNLAFTADPESQHKLFSLDAVSTYNFSPEQNVIVLVLDTFQSDVFQEIIEEDPTHTENFKGFTFFPDNIGGYPKTYPALVLALMEKYYKNAQPLVEFIKEVYPQDSLPRILKQHGFDISLPVSLPSACDTTLCANYREKNNHDIVPLLGLSIFYDLPFFGKEIFYKQYPDFFKPLFKQLGIKDNVDFMQDINTLAQKNNTSKAFKFFHLRGAHQPYTLNENLEYEQMPHTRLSYVRQSKASLKIAEQFLLYLKEKGLYDSSMIIILGDHGAGIPPAKKAPASDDAPKFEYINDTLKNLANPLLLIKKPFADGDFSSSTVEASLGDVPQTILSTLDIRNNLGGYNLLDPSSVPTNRDRYFRFYSWQGVITGGPIMHELLINGPISDMNSWQPTFRTYSYSGEGSYFPPPIKLNVPITFNNTSNTNNYLGGGWGEPEKTNVWSIDYKASLLLPLVELSDSSEYKISIKGTPFIASSLKQQHISIFANDKLVKETSMNAPGVITFNVKKELITDGNLYLTLAFPDAHSPAEFQLNPDVRLLSFALQEILVESAQ